MTVGHLNKLAVLDGFGVRKAKDQSQRSAWRGHFGIFRGDSFQFASDNPYRIRAWLAANAPRSSA